MMCVCKICKQEFNKKMHGLNTCEECIYKTSLTPQNIEYIQQNYKNISITDLHKHTKIRRNHVVRFLQEQNLLTEYRNHAQDRAYRQSRTYHQQPCNTTPAGARVMFAVDYRRTGNVDKAIKAMCVDLGQPRQKIIELLGAEWIDNLETN